ncbi:MAG: phosphate acyltransferase PlsX [Desulfovibrio sp.]|nr:phosphate acyltransferase PlsX [Desulfovibrio sp.]
MKGRSGGQKIAEMIIYDKILTDAERGQVEAYLQAKWFGHTPRGWNGNAALASLRANTNATIDTSVGIVTTVDTPPNETLAIGRLKGVERPALCTLLPTEKKPVIVLDVGANVDCRPYHLFQFGLMGDAFARDILNYASPRVSILSIGEEEGKGNSQVKESYELLKLAKNLNFIGNAEGRDIFTGNVDVVVCDGFVGNIVVKMGEGLAMSLTRMLKSVFKSSPLAMLGGLLARGAFRKFKRTIDYAEYGGAPLLGLKHLAIVCHGKSNSKAMTSAIRMAATFVRKNTQEKLAETIQTNEELTRLHRQMNA